MNTRSYIVEYFIKNQRIGFSSFYRILTKKIPYCSYANLYTDSKLRNHKQIKNIIESFSSIF